MEINHPHQIRLRYTRMQGLEVCQKNLNYRTETSANREAAKETMKTGLQCEAYPCYYCQGWHIGPPLTTDELKMYTIPA